MNQDLKLATELYADAYEAASKVVASGSEHPGPVMLALLTDGRRVMIDLSFVSKDFVAAAHVKLAGAEAVAGTVLILESWMHRGPQSKVTDAVRRGEVRVSELPDRTEAIVFNVRIKSKQYLAICEIDRERATLAQSELKDVGDPKHGTFLGRFIDAARKDLH